MAICTIIFLKLCAICHLDFSIGLCYNGINEREVIKMYYYKTYYTDGTWDILKSKKAIHNSKLVCETCYKIQLKTIGWYYFQKIKYFLKNY